MLDSPQALWEWFYNPGETVRSIGFIKNPYRQWHLVKFGHIFGMDSKDNLYVGQFSVYDHHLKEFFGPQEFLETGKTILEDSPLAIVNYIEPRKIVTLNQRLKSLAQRLYDYGMPPNTIIKAKNTDLGNPSLFNILGGKLIERPDRTNLAAKLGLL